MLYEVESEVHSFGKWLNADFKMYYNLDASFPEPATYFDVKSFLVNLLAPPLVEFEKKNAAASIVWVVSNCNAHNGRQIFMKALMKKAKVVSAGSCLQNKFDHPSTHFVGNVELFSKYKFVIAIENSNCIDYVTEKLDYAIRSGHALFCGLNFLFRFEYFF